MGFKRIPASRYKNNLINKGILSVEMAGVEPASELGCSGESTVRRNSFGLKSLALGNPKHKRFEF